MKRKCKKKLLACGLALIMVLTSLGSTGVEAGAVEKSEVSLAAVSKDFAYTMENMGEILNKQMGDYLTGSDNSGVQAADDVMELGNNQRLISCITFPLEEYHIAYDNYYFYHYFLKAISEYPTLCAFYRIRVKTQYDISNGMQTIKYVSLFSPFAKEDIKPITIEYCKKFDELVSTIEKSSMSEMEKLLYLHDELVVRTEYDKDSSNVNNHLPVGLLVEGKSVCDGYARTFNQAALRLGFNSLYLTSDGNIELKIWGHAWNAVELDGKWYYVDATYDDPVGATAERDYVSHIYFLFNMAQIDADNTKDIVTHTLSEGPMEELYGYILKNMGDAYRNIPPRRVMGQMNYLNGVWYYTDGWEVYSWDGKSAEGATVTSIPPMNMQKCAVYNGKLYVSGKDGLYFYEDEKMTQLLSDSIEKMVIIDGTMHYKTNGEWKTEAPDNFKPIENVKPSPAPTPSEPDGENPSPAPTPSEPDGENPSPVPSPSEPAATSPGPEPSETPSQETAPGKVVISSIKNIKTKSLTFKIKKVKEATGYEYCYATGKGFKNGRTNTTKNLSVTIKKLQKNKTYYVKVRAYSAVKGKRTYGKWSDTKKVKIKK